MSQHAANPTEERPLDPSSALARLVFDNRFTRSLPADPETGNHTRPVTGAAFSRVRPVPVPEPRIIAWSKEVSDQLGLSDEVWSGPEAAEVFTGNRILPGSDPFAMAYGGHQFGNWAGQLGDGRAIALGEVVDRHGAHQMLQLKGAGPTPYSRRADGLAVLRSSIREFLCSEAMHHLGVPTTRALSLALTGTQVLRDLLYDGHPALEPGAVVCRVAPSFIRFGNFQILAARDDIDLLRTLADFTITHYFGHLGAPSPEVYAAWFDEVCRTSCDLAVDWMRVGFVHGVLNTDNMSIHGLTIDYGPYGWVDDYDPGWTPNTTDAAGRRYRFGQQPQVVQWNLLQLANAIYPLVGEAAPFEASLDAYADRFSRRYREAMLAKLGLRPADGADDEPLLSELTSCLAAVETDMTIFFRRLADLPAEVPADGPTGAGATEPGVASADLLGPDGLGAAFYTPEAVPDAHRARLVAWLDRYRARLAHEGRPAAERREAMNRVNPCYVLRNYLAQQVIDAAEAGDLEPLHELARVLERPYDTQPGRAVYAARRPDWARNRPGCSMLSCSS